MYYILTDSLWRDHGFYLFLFFLQLDVADFIELCVCLQPTICVFWVKIFEVF